MVIKAGIVASHYNCSKVTAEGNITRPDKLVYTIQPSPKTQPRSSIPPLQQHQSNNNKKGIPRSGSKLSQEWGFQSAPTVGSLRDTCYLKPIEESAFHSRYLDVPSSCKWPVPTRLPSLSKNRIEITSFSSVGSSWDLCRWVPLISALVHLGSFETWLALSFQVVVVWMWAGHLLWSPAVHSTWGPWPAASFLWSLPAWFCQQMK